MNAMHRSFLNRRRQSGFTLVELMIALLIALFLLGGLSILVQDNRRTFSNQSLLAQLQDSERLAMTLMTDVIQTTGYFPSPRTNTLALAMAAQAGMVAGQSMTGLYSATAPGDTITVQYQTNSGDGILNCSGSPNTSGGPVAYANTFFVAVNAAGVSQLECTVTAGGVATTYPLVNNVTQLSVLYGVNSAGTSNNVDSFMTATAVSAAAAWNNVVSAQVTLTFNNPLYTSATAPGQGTQPATLSFTRTIGLMSKTGI